MLRTMEHASLPILWQRAYFQEGEVQFVLCVFTSIKQRVCFSFHTLQEQFSRWIKPPTTSVLAT